MTDAEPAWRADDRPPKLGWAPGTYMCNCFRCNQSFMGDKRAVCCAPCAYGASAGTWQPIETAPKDGTIIDVWLGDASEDDLEFYCMDGGRRATGWWWKGGKFRPHISLFEMPTFVHPTHWMPLPGPPSP